MGNDGGSIPTRRELVKEAAKNPTTTQMKETRQEKQEYYWTTDPITNDALIPPIVSDSSGKLYNKQTILEYLLPSEDDSSKEEAEKILQGNVKSLKDVVEVKFVADKDSTAQSNGSKKGEKWICPVTDKTLGPGSKAVYIVPCGHAFVAAAIKEVAGETCPQCDQAYAPNDVIPIIPIEETDIARLILRKQTLQDQGLSHALKKLGGKKRKKNGEKTDVKDEAPVLSNEKKTSGIKNSSTASLTAKVLAEQEERNKKRKVNPNDNLNSLFSSNKPSGKNRDFMTRGFSIPAQNK